MCVAARGATACSSPRGGIGESPSISASRARCVSFAAFHASGVFQADVGRPASAAVSRRKYSAICRSPRDVPSGFSCAAATRMFHLSMITRTILLKFEPLYRRQKRDFRILKLASFSNHTAILEFRISLMTFHDHL